jgi:peptidoglycan biosynthesis protein MviN/MurJ (putative lipid II flippase)
MLRIPVQSRNGNVALVVIGAIYALGASVVLAWFAIDVKGAEAMLDRLMQLGLLVAAMCGVWFIANAIENLRVRSSRRGLPHFQRPSSGAK